LGHLTGLFELQMTASTMTSFCLLFSRAQWLMRKSAFEGHSCHTLHIFSKVTEVTITDI